MEDKKTFYGETLITKEGIENLKVYQYKGIDRSLINKYISEPIA